MDLVDTHCHLDHLEHSPLEEILENAKGLGVSKMLTIGASRGVESAKSAVELANHYPFIWASIGIHPHDAGLELDFSQIRQHADEPRVVAVGETGLDFFREWAPFDLQRKLFEQNINFAREIRKPLIIHCRDAGEECLSFLTRLKAAEVGGVFHCYSEGSEFAKKLADINFKVSFPGTVTFKKADKLRDAVEAIPLDQIMLETDCPFMAPEPFRGKPSEPMHVFQIALKVAEIKGITIEEVASATTKNAQDLFGF